jgi:von Willebrand factor type D domain
MKGTRIFYVATLLCIVTAWPAARADAQSLCHGTAMYFGNGVNNTRADAEQAMWRLPELADEALVHVDALGLAYNPTDGLLADALETIRQKIRENPDFSWYLLNSIALYTMGGLPLPAELSFRYGPLVEDLRVVLPALMATAVANVGTEDAIAGEHLAQYRRDVVGGRRVMVVAHSQGNMFANIAHAGMAISPAWSRAFGIAAVATPAQEAFDGYVTSSSDLIITLLRQLGRTVLPANLVAAPSFGDLTGHTFLNTYMKAPARTPVVNLLRGLGQDVAFPDVECPLVDGPSGALGPTIVGGAWGDPHLYTFDGYHYDLQRVGEFVLVQSVSGGPVVQARFQPYRASRTIAIIAAIAANVNGDIVQIEVNEGDGLTLLVNGVPGRGRLPKGGTLSDSAVVWPDGSLLRITDRGDHLNVKVTLESGAKPTGLLGNVDDDPFNDFVLRDGSPLIAPLSSDDVATFVRAWRISQAESLFTYPSGLSTTTYTDLTFPESEARAAFLDAEAYARARAICVAQGVEEYAVMEACILDVATTGDARFAEAAVGLPRPLGAPPSVYRFEAAPDSLMTDLVGSSAASPLAPDGRPDGVFHLSVQGPVSGLVVATVNQTGRAAGGSYWDSLVGQAIPADVAGLGGRTTNWVVGASFRGESTLLNDAEGAIPLLDGSVHDLDLHVSSDGSIRRGTRLRVWAVGPGGTASASQILVYP